VFRRDPALGLGHVLASFPAALVVWVAGDAAQRADVASRLLRGDRIASGFHELDLGDGGEGGCSAVRDGGRWIVTGVELIRGPDRAESMVVKARTQPEPDAASHSLLWWVKDPESRAFARTSERLHMVGLRGCEVGAVTLRGLPIATDHTIGIPGEGTQTALTAAQVSHAVVPSLAVATVDAAIELAVQYGSERRLYGGTVLDLPHARALLAGVVADLLVADALAAVVVRALHLAPAECLVLTAASRHVVPHLLDSAMQDLSVLFGSTFYAKVEPFGLFEKYFRDVAAMSIGQAGDTARLLPILQNLPEWLRSSRQTDAFDPALFDLGAPLGEIEFGRFTLGAGSSDPLGAALLDAAERSRLEPEVVGGDALQCLVGGFDALRDEIRDLPESESGVDAQPAAFSLAHRLTLFLAAGAWAGVCTGRTGSPPTLDPLVRAAGFERIAGRIRGWVGPLDADAVEHLVAFAGPGRRLVYGTSVSHNPNGPGST